MYLTLAEIQAFINFVNGNLGKKIFTDANPSAVVAGKKLLTNGVGLGVDMVDDISYQLGIVGDWDITTQPVLPVDLQVGQRYIVTTEGTYNGVFADVGDIVEFTSLTSIFVYPVASTLIRLSDLTNYATKTYAESLVLGLLDDRGSYDPTITSAYPTIENFGSGVDGSILKGDLWFINADGVIGTIPVLTGYSVRALVDDPGQIDSNWNILSVGLGYVSENVDNKKTSLNGALSSPNDTDYPSTLVVDDALNLKADILNETHTGAMRLPSSLKIYDVISTTREVAVNVSGLTAGTPRTVTFPDRDIALGDVPLFAATTKYKQYAAIQDNGTLYTAKVDFTSGSTFNVSDWDSLGGSSFKSMLTGSATLAIGYEYYNVASPNAAITCELPDPTLVPDGSRIVIHNLAFNAATTLGRTAWPSGSSTSVFLQAPNFQGFVNTNIPAYSKGVITTLTSSITYGWIVETQTGNVIPLGTTPGAGKTYFAREDDTSATLSHNLSAIPSSTNIIITVPKFDVNLANVITGYSYNAATGVITFTKTDTSTTTLNVAPTQWTNITADTVSTTMVAGLSYIAYNTATGKTYTLPASPVIGQVVQITSSTFTAFNQTVARNGSTINGVNADFTLSLNGTYRFFFNASSTWVSSYTTLSGINQLLPGFIGISPNGATALQANKRYYFGDAGSNLSMEPSLTLPANPAIGDTIEIHDIYNVLFTVDFQTTDGGIKRVILTSSTANIANYYSASSSITLNYAGSGSPTLAPISLRKGAVIYVSYLPCHSGLGLGNVWQVYIGASPQSYTPRIPFTHLNHVAHDASGGVTGTSTFAVPALTGIRTITVPDADVNLGELATVYSPLINTQSTAITAYTLGTVTTDNNGKTYLRMTATAANTVTVPSTQTKPINISQRGVGATTLVAGSTVVLNGNVYFTDVNQTKTLIPLGLSAGVYYFDIIG